MLKLYCEECKRTSSGQALVYTTPFQKTNDRMIPTIDSVSCWATGTEVDFIHSVIPRWMRVLIIQKLLEEGKMPCCRCCGDLKWKEV